MSKNKLNYPQLVKVMLILLIRAIFIKIMFRKVKKFKLNKIRFFN